MQNMNNFTMLPALLQTDAPVKHNDAGLDVLALQNVHTVTMLLALLQTYIHKLHVDNNNQLYFPAHVLGVCGPQASATALCPYTKPLLFGRNK